MPKNGKITPWYASYEFLGNSKIKNRATIVVVDFFFAIKCYGATDGINPL
jgi:hypothetical protein